MGKVMHLSYEEFAGNLTELLNKVRADETSIVVEYGSGENVVIKRASATRRGVRRKHGSHEPREKANQQPPPATLDRENVSSVGAVYDIDPNSITPG